jgi:protein tyrosine phosphatase (PTP) superfamily phosphohydrolase (DUF442 family)
VYAKKSIPIILAITVIILIATVLFIFRQARVNGDAEAKGGQVVRLEDDSAEVKVTLPLFQRLNANYTRGGQPARGGIGALARLGVMTIIDLRSIYDHTDEVGVAAERIGLKYYWLPMSVWNPPTDEQANQFVSVVLDDSLGPFFVFCADGVNRTGELSAIYRITHDNWTIGQAIKEMDSLGFNPYYYTLRSYVWDYARKFRPESVPKGARRLSDLGL